jgi:hypothetical protein
MLWIAALVSLLFLCGALDWSLMSVARLTAQRDKAIQEREEMELGLRQLQAKNELLDVLKSKPMTIAKVILIFFLKDKGKLIIIGLTILSVSSCIPLVPLVERTPATAPPRSFRVAIVHENFSEKEILSTAKMIQEGFERYPGVRLGAVTTIPIDLGGCRTLSAIYRKAFQTCIPLGPKYADIFVIRTNRLLYQDGFFMVCGMVQLGSTEKVYRRFVILLRGWIEQSELAGLESSKTWEFYDRVLVDIQNSAYKEAYDSFYNSHNHLANPGPR